MKPKKIPPWALIGGAVLLGVAFYFWKKNKEKHELEAEQKQQEPTVAGVTNPEEEYPYSIVGGGGGGPAGAVSGAETRNELAEFFTQERGERIKEKGERESETGKIGGILQQISSQISGLQTSNAPGGSNQGSTQNQGGGGGAPSEHKQGTTVAPTTPQDRCGTGTHAGFPNGTPPDCWRISRQKTGGGCECHGHQNGHLECQKGKAPHCYW